MGGMPFGFAYFSSMYILYTILTCLSIEFVRFVRMMGWLGLVLYLFPLAWATMGYVRAINGLQWATWAISPHPHTHAHKPIH